MKLYALDIPEETSQLASWLARHLVGPNLAELVAELSAVHTPDETSESVEELFGTSLDEVLDRGLENVPQITLLQLLRQPRLLLDLQEQVLEEGGQYWQRLTVDSGELAGSFQRGRLRLQSHLVDQREPESATLSIPWYRRPQWVSLMTAAAVVLVMLGLQGSISHPPEAKSTAWGWNRADAMPTNVTEREYLDALADGAEQWFNKRPQDAASLAQRIGELRQGCSRLILADHEPLSADDGQWLVGKCREWAAKIDEQLVALEAGAEPHDVLAQMDMIVDKLAHAIRGRAPV